VPNYGHLDNLKKKIAGASPSKEELDVLTQYLDNKYHIFISSEQFGPGPEEEDDLDNTNSGQLFNNFSHQTNIDQQI
jgi:hypothetical protein